MVTTTASTTTTPVAPTKPAPSPTPTETPPAPAPKPNEGEPMTPFEPAPRRADPIVPDPGRRHETCQHPRLDNAEISPSLRKLAITDSKS